MLLRAFHSLIIIVFFVLFCDVKYILITCIDVLIFGEKSIAVDVTLDSVMKRKIELLNTSIVYLPNFSFFDLDPMHSSYFKRSSSLAGLIGYVPIDSFQLFKLYDRHKPLLHPDKIHVQMFLLLL